MKKDSEGYKPEDRLWKGKKKKTRQHGSDRASGGGSFANFILLLDSLPDLFWAKDMDDRFLFVNRAICEKLLKCGGTDEALGKTDLFFAERERRNGFDHTFGDICINSDHVVKQSGKPERFLEEGRVRGKYLLLDVYKAPVFDDKGKMVATVGCGRDVTREKEIETEREHARKRGVENKRNALIGQVVGKMAHDFNNILGVIMGLSELAMLDCRQNDISQALKDILFQADRGKALTRNLITFARNKEPVFLSFSVREKFSRILCIMKKELEGIDFNLEIEEGLPDLIADPDMFETIIVNLMVNSIHAVSKARNPKIRVKALLSEGHILLEVEDNGCGIPHEFKENIYEPAFTLKGGKDTACSYHPCIKGAGYGLSNAKRIMDKHNGTISFDSDLCKGTKFVLSFPVRWDELTAQEKKTIERKGIVKKKRILVVEDEQAISRVQYSILSALPFEHQVDIAYDGHMAMDFISRGEYDLISLDYMLPGEYNGMDVYHYIRRLNRTIPVLMISGNIEFIESTQHLMVKDRMLSHLSKPCRNLEYMEAVNRLLILAGAEL